MKNRVASRSLLLVLPLLLAVSGVTQENTAEITGTVTDPLQAPIKDVTVEISNYNIGFLRSAVTNERGLYNLSAIPVGVYQLALRKEGFRGERIESVELVVRQTRTVNAQLQLASQAQDIQISAAAAALDESSAEVGGVLVGSQVAQLPLNGRSWISLMALVPGAIDMGGGTQRTIRFAGHGVDDNNYRIDGIDATGVLNQSQSGNFRLQTSTEAIAEFRVDSMLFSAETGGSIGGQVQAISKSGTNAYHGSAFEYIRNDILDARGPFDPSTLPPLRMNQFGASLGGSIIRDRLFFFAAYEGLQQSQLATLIGFVPSDSFRARALAQSPALAPLLAAYPAGTSSVTADIWRRTAQVAQRSTENSGMFRLDYRLSNTTSLFARYNTDHGSVSQPSGNLSDVINVTGLPTNETVQLSHVFSPTMTNQVALGVNRPYSFSQTIGTLGTVSNVPYALSVAGLSTLNQTKGQLTAPTTYSVDDNWSWIRGQHTVKAGVEIKKVNLDYNVATAQNVNYTSLSNFAANKMDSLVVVGGIPTVGDHKTEYFGYAQDEWKIKPNLTVNIGLRYEFFNVFREIYGRSLPFDIETCGGYCKVGSAFLFPPTNNLEPRVAFAWAPAIFHGGTVIRSGFGLYKGEGQLGDTKSPSDNYTQQGYYLSSAQFPSLSYPADALLSSNTAAAAAPRSLQRKIADPTVLQWGLQIQSRLPGAFVLDTGYVGNHGYHQFTRTEVNVIDPLTGQRPLAGFGEIDAKRYDSTESFQAWQTSLNRRLSNGWLFSVSYMWSHSLNDGTAGGGDANYPMNVFCRSCEKASSAQDIRHVFTADTVYQLPLWHGRRFLGGWQLSAITTARSGDPLNIVVTRSASVIPDGDATTQGSGLTVQRPNLVPGVSLTPSGGSTVQQWINPAAFAIPANGTFGNLRRNVFRGPSHWQADVALVKNFPIVERYSVDFRIEAFNVFNHPQLGDPNTNISAPSFGTITSTVNNGVTGNGTPRIYEFSIRFRY